MSSRNVNFKLDSDENTSINTKSTFSVIKQKRRNSKLTISSIEKCRRRSINKHSTNNLFRTDVFGNEIIKGNKNHKVSFIDMISSQRIAEIILIDKSSSVFENYNNNDDKENCQCSTCEIF